MPTGLYSGSLGQLFQMEGSKVEKGPRIYSPGRLGKTTVPSCDGAEEYGVAHVLPYVDGGTTVDVVMNGISRLNTFAKRDVQVPSKVLEVVEFLCVKLSKESIVVSPNWDETFFWSRFASVHYAHDCGRVSD